ncbi:dipeptidyl anminopeptidase [Plesiocystis pacifica SIR-1]|uniref:Dipeptidyl anminopeptidase n=1 Tax=Plesiocystis pacifica SIR-1 TaxID=391625 RepID=A6G9X3_9BACT|nr:S9 family peptidase [Plesiocystis pacifica]EDM77298.1 dipeptidyl anminopeptidase [Plesiocystis pacifica SIR-1]
MKAQSTLSLALILAAASACSPTASLDATEPGGGGKANAQMLAKGTANPDLIPRELLFGNPDRAAPRLSPDGKRIMWLAPDEGVLNVWVAPAGKLDAGKVVTKDRLRGIRNAGWTADGRYIIYAQDQAGNENWHLHRIDPEVGASSDTDLTPNPEVRAQMVGGSREQPKFILVGINDRNPAHHDVYRMNIETGERTLVEQNDAGYAGYVSDENLELRYAYAPRPDGGIEILAPGGDKAGRGHGKKDWAPIEAIEQIDSMSTQDAGFDASGRYRYMIDSRGRDTGALIEIDTETDERKVLYQDPKAELGGVMRDAKTRKPVAVTVNWDKPRWEVLDPSYADDFAALEQVKPGNNFAITDQTREGDQWIVAYYSDKGSVSYYQYDRATKDSTFLFFINEALEGLELASMHPRVIESRDGLELVSYLSLPPSSDPDDDGVPDEPVPMVLLVHGGPWARDNWGYNPMAQWLTNRGYAVLSVNFRGSTGFGKAFTAAGDKEWAAKMHDDLLDAVDWAVDTKVTSKDSVAIMGGSYGGYATLVGLTFTPEVFACGVDIVGPSNLVTLLETIPPYWAPMVAQFTTRVGDHRTEEGRALLESRSPLNRVDAIVKPLLIGQGANDPRVKQAEADQIVAAMTEREIPVTYALFPDEGHGFARPSNSQAFNAVAETFLAGCLGGEYLPISDIGDSTLQVPAGRELIPGLSEQLDD